MPTLQNIRRSRPIADFADLQAPSEMTIRQFPGDQRSMAGSKIIAGTEDRDRGAGLANSLGQER